MSAASDDHSLGLAVVSDDGVLSRSYILELLAGGYDASIAYAGS